MRKVLYTLVLAFCLAGFSACESKTSNSETTSGSQTNTDAAEGNTGVGVGATGTDNTTGETGTHADTSHEGHGH